MEQQSPQQEPDNSQLSQQPEHLLLQELLALHHLLPLPEQFSKQEEQELTLSLSHPTVIRYFQLLANNAVRDTLMNEFERFDDQPKLLARFNKLKGIIMVCNQILTTYSGRR